MTAGDGVVSDSFWADFSQFAAASELDIWFFLDTAGNGAAPLTGIALKGGWTGGRPFVAPGAAAMGWLFAAPVAAIAGVTDIDGCKTLHQMVVKHEFIHSILVTIIYSSCIKNCLQLYYYFLNQYLLVIEQYRKGELVMW